MLIKFKPTLYIMYKNYKTFIKFIHKRVNMHFRKFYEHILSTVRDRYFYFTKCLKLETFNKKFNK